MSYLQFKFGIVFTSLALFNAPATASCGLQFCPLPTPETESKWKVGLTSELTGFDFAYGMGTYLTTLPRVQYRPVPAVLLSLHIPVTFLDIYGESDAFGLGNPFVQGEYRLNLALTHSLSFGAQLEIPLGDHSAGLADDHFMLLPFVTYVGFGGNLKWALQTGWAQSLSGHHDHAESQVYVRPHSEREWVFNAVAGYLISLWNLEPQFGIDGQIPVADNHDHGPGLVSEGESEEARLFGFTALAIDVAGTRFSPGFKWPLTRARNLDWSLFVKIDREL